MSDAEQMSNPLEEFDEGIDDTERKELDKMSSMEDKELADYIPDQEISDLKDVLSQEKAHLEENGQSGEIFDKIDSLIDRLDNLDRDIKKSEGKDISLSGGDGDKDTDNDNDNDIFSGKSSEKKDNNKLRDTSIEEIFNDDRISEKQKEDWRNLENLEFPKANNAHLVFIDAGGKDEDQLSLDTSGDKDASKDALQEVYPNLNVTSLSFDGNNTKDLLDELGKIMSESNSGDVIIPVISGHGTSNERLNRDGNEYLLYGVDNKIVKEVEEKSHNIAKEFISNNKDIIKKGSLDNPDEMELDMNKLKELSTTIDLNGKKEKINFENATNIERKENMSDYYIFINEIVSRLLADNNNAISSSDLAKEFSKSEAKVLPVIDSCFSGAATNDSDLIESTYGIISSSSRMEKSMQNPFTKAGEFIGSFFDNVKNGKNLGEAFISADYEENYEKDNMSQNPKANLQGQKIASNRDSNDRYEA